MPVTVMQGQTARGFVVNATNAFGVLSSPPSPLGLTVGGPGAGATATFQADGRTFDFAANGAPPGDYSVMVTDNSGASTPLSPASTTVTITPAPATALAIDESAVTVA